MIIIVLGYRKNVRSIEESVCDSVVKSAHRFVNMRASLRAKIESNLKMRRNCKFLTFSIKNFFQTKIEILFFDRKLHKCGGVS